MFLGILFLIELIAIGYFYFADPLGLFQKDTTVNTTEKVVDQPADNNPLLNESQEAALEKIGVDTTSLPSTITPAMESCFIEKLGQPRVDEIISGDSPSAIDLFKAKDCIN